MRAIALMSWWQLRNSLRTTLTEPRKLIPALFLAGVLGLNVFNFLFLGSMSRHDQVPLVADFVRSHLGAAHAALFAALILAAVAQIESGLTGGALTFSLPDVDYLFPSPISRRVVLLYKVPMILLRNAFYAAGFLVFIYLGLHLVLSESGVTLPALPIYIGVAAWLSGYTCIAVALEVVFGLGKAALARRLGWAFVLVAVVSLVASVWRGGFDCLALLERSPIVWIPMYPCKILADVFAAPITGRPTGGAVAQLLVFCLAALAILLTRTEDYYEATLTGSERVARIRAAARQGSFAGILAARAQDRTHSMKDQGRPYTLPLFGRGAGALFWAHLCAASKRPIPNFAVPFAGGAAVSLGITIWAAPSMAGLVAGADAYVTWLYLMVATRTAFRQCAQLGSLVRPMPLPAWKIVVADVAPTVLTSSLFSWGAALPLLVPRGGDTGLIAAALVFIAPMVICPLALVMYVIALWYPSAEDKMQQLLSGLVSMALLACTALVLTPFILVPVLLHARLQVTAASGIIGCVCASVALVLFAASVFRRSETA